MRITLCCLLVAVSCAAPSRSIAQPTARLDASDSAAAPIRVTTLESMSPRQRAEFDAFVKERLEFARDMYHLTDEAVAELRAWANAQTSSHLAYMDRHAVTLRRRETALSSMLSRMKDVTDETRVAVAERMQLQIYDILGAAPLSYAGVLRQAEALVPPFQAAQGRTEVSLTFSDLLGGAEVDISKIDRLLVPPVQIGTRPDPLQMATARARSAAAPEPSPSDRDLRAFDAKRRSIEQPTENAPLDGSAVSEPTLKPSEEAPSPAPPAPALDRRPAPPPPLPAAPPIAEWTNEMMKVAKKYEFSAEQTQTAQGILASCKGRAEAWRESKQSEYDRARGIQDAADRSRALRELDKPLDKLFDEMKRRVDAVASVEQKQRAARSESPKADTAEE